MSSVSGRCRSSSGFGPDHPRDHATLVDLAVNDVIGGQPFHGGGERWLSTGAVVVECLSAVGVGARDDVFAKLDGRLDVDAPVRPLGGLRSLGRSVATPTRCPGSRATPCRQRR